MEKYEISQPNNKERMRQHSIRSLIQTLQPPYLLDDWVFVGPSKKFPKENEAKIKLRKSQGAFPQNRLVLNI